ncbi:MAG: hypothetical protein ACRDT6_14590 [Micromonosporaceae bacterium]
MQTTTALLPGAGQGDDRVFVTNHAVIMLDGASAFVPVPVPASAYADRLGAHLRRGVRENPSSDLRDLLRSAIERTADELGLSPGESPCSTVTILRELDGQIEILVLGDNLVILAGEHITDDRMDQLRLAPRREYRERLAAGYGYDTTHHVLLRQLQTQQAAMRNRPGGYWIAEADPSAAEHALLIRRSVESVPWAVLATDGAYETMRHLGLAGWKRLATMDEVELARVLRRCHSWESEVDPHGQALPRAKRHDDKALAGIAFAHQ